MINKQNVLNILLIEDSAADTLLFEEMIAQCAQPCKVKTAARLSTALQFLEEERFDVVLLDLFLPDSSSIETFQKIQAQASDLPVVILTGFADEKLAVEAIALGAQDYLFKGKFNRDLMYHSILYAIERKQAANQVRRAKELSDGINRINTLIFSTLDFDEIMKLVVEEAAKATGADGAAIYFPDGDQWAARYVYGLAGLAGRRITSEDIKYSLLAARERRPVLVNDIVGNEEMCRIPLIQEYRVKALLDAPLSIGEDVVGDFALYSCGKNESFNEQHAEFMNKVSASVSLALRNAELFESLRESESRLHEITATAHDAVILIDNDGNVSFWNHAATRMFGYTREEIIGKYLHSYIMPERHVDAFRKGFEAFQKTGKGPFIGTVYEIEAKRKDGTEFPVELSLSAVMLKGKWNAVGIVRDITDRKRLERSLNRSYGLMKIIIDSMSEAISLIDVLNFNIVAVNKSFLKEYGYSDESEIIGKRCYEVTHRRDIVCAPPNDICPLQNTVKKGEIFAVEHAHYGKGGEKLYFEISTSPIKDENGNVVQVVHVQRNITERKRMEEEIMHMALHDPLTGLPNRRLFIDIVNVERNQAARHRNKMAILFLDLDRFKEVNDTLGHEAGDLLLKEAASRLKAVVRKSDTIARIGGDEFNVILADLVRAEDSTDIARKILRSFQKPFMVSGHQLLITTSIGISIYPDDSEDVETLQRYADIAMYYAKEDGRNKYQFYNPSINVRSLEQIGFENMLRRSIDLGELVIYYQPLVDIRTRRVVCAEALARWRHPQKGLLEPKDFIHAAEATGFINEIDEWALTTVCRQATAWLEAGSPPVCVTVNLSARQFQDPDLVKKVSSILAETGMPPNCLDLEVTETIAMTDVERSAVRLKELTKMGIRISIDDFGTGYSSLNYLKRLPIERLKIDKTFVQDIATDPDDRSIVKAVTAMAHNMKMKVVAEGVETEEQLEFLRKTGCDEMQGFLFSKPLSAEEFEELLKAA